MFSTFFLAYPSFLHLFFFFYSDVWPSALRIRMEESAVIVAAYDVLYGEDMRECPIKKHPLVSSASHNGQVYCCAPLVFTLFLLITKSLFPILPHIIRHSRLLIYSFWAHNKEVAKAAKNPFSNVIFSQKNSKREKITLQSLLHLC